MSAAIQGIYIALFGRPADPGGLAYWTDVTKGGTDLSAMLNVLPSLTEYTSRFDGMTPDQVITTVYQNLFGREPDAEGLAFFKGQLASGAQTLATIAVNIMQGAQGDDKADVDAKVGAAELFTASLDTPAEIAAYSGADAAALAKKFLDSVDKDAPATAESVEKASAAVVAGEDPTGGQAPGGGGTGGGGGGTTTPPAPLTFALSDGDDTFGGGAGDDTFNAIDANVLGTGDTLIGGAGTDVLNISAGAQGPDKHITPTLSGIEIINNLDNNHWFDLARSTGVKEVWTTLSGNSSDQLNQIYMNASTDTLFGVRGNNINEGTLSLRFPNRGQNDTIKLALEDNQGYQAIYFGAQPGGGSAIEVGKVALNLGEGSAGSLSIRNPIDDLTVTGKGSVTYITHSTPLKNFDASAVEGYIRFQGTGDGGAVAVSTNSSIRTGAGDDLLNFSTSTGNLSLDGGAGNDKILGGSGNDTINGGAGNDIIWGDNPKNTALTPALYGDDVINGGSGSNVIVLGTKAQNVKLGGQDTIILDAADGGTNVVFNFNFGPTDRVDGLSGGVNVPGASDADKTFDIVKFSNANESTIKISIGQADSDYQQVVTEAGGATIFTGNTFSLAGNTVYTGTPSNLELMVEAGGSKIIFANAISKWELGGLLRKTEQEIRDGSLDTFITALNAKLDGADAAAGLVPLTGGLSTDLTNFLKAQGNFDFGA